MSLIINISSLLGKPVGESQSFVLKETLPNLDGLSAETPFEGKAVFSRFGGGVIVKIQGKTELKLTCARCGKFFRAKSQVSAEKTYWETADGDYEKELIPPNKQINLFPTIREEILVQIPIKPLCSKLCKGLCPFCGADLNDKKCKCQNILKKESPFDKLRKEIK